MTLNGADLELLKRDRELPGLELVLDPESMLNAACLEGGVAQPRITYVRYKPATRCLVGYRFEAAGGTREAYATAYPPRERAKLLKTHEASRPSGSGTWPASVIVEDCAVVLSFFPNDRKIGALLALAEPELRRRLLAKLLPDTPDLWSAELERLAYKPERRYVGMLVGQDGQRAVLRAYTTEGYQAAVQSSKSFQSRPSLAVPQRLGRSQRHRLLAFEWLRGSALDEVTRRDAVLPDVGYRVGAALAALHAQNPRRLAPRTAAEDAASLGALAAWLGFLLPCAAETSAALANRLQERLRSLPPESRAIHGDIHSRQVLLQDHAVGLLDLDEAVRGDPAADIGNFIAHLERDALQGARPPPQVDLFSGALSSGYGSTGADLSESRIRLYTAVGLFRLSPEPFRNRDPDWPARLEALLERADCILSGDAKLDAV